MGCALALVLSAGSLPGQLVPGARTAADSSAVNPEDSSSDAYSQAAAEADASKPQYVPALNGSGLFLLQAIEKFHMLGGGSISAGLDTNPNNQSDHRSSIVYIFSPFVGVLAGNPRRQFLLQYRPIFTEYTTYAQNSMQQASAAFAKRPSPRWSWTIGVNGAHGDDAVRMLAPGHSVAVGGVAGSGSGNAAYLANAGVVTNINGAIEAVYGVSERDTLGVQIADSFNSYSQLHSRNSVATAIFNYTHALKPTVDVLAYQQTSRYYGDLQCTAFGGGVGLAWKPRAETTLSIQGGPQLNSPNCRNQQGFSYHAFISSKVTARSQLYVRGDRQPLIGFLGPGLWQDDVSAGYQRAFSSKNSAGADAGYVMSSTLSSGQAYSGTFANAWYTRQIMHPLSLSCRYQNFVASQGVARFSRNVVLVSITLTPGSPSLTE